MIYQFVCVDCPKSPTTGASVMTEREFPMMKAPGLGKPIKCPCCGRRTCKRVISTGIAARIAGKVEVDWKNGETVTKEINGKQIRMTFVDHPDTSAECKRDFSKLSNKGGATGRSGLGKAYYSEKHGCPVVDVMSNVPDPLGVIERAKQSGNYSQTKTMVNAPYKRRKAR